MPAPIPCAVPVTSATRPVRSGIPALLEQRPDLLDAPRPDTENVGLGPLVGAAEGAVAEQLAHLARIELAHRRDVRHRLPLGWKLYAVEARPGEVLEPGGVCCVGVDLVDDRTDSLARPPVVPPHRGAGMSVGPRLDPGTALSPAAAASWRPAGSEPSARPQDSEIAGTPARLYGPVNRPSTSPSGVPNGGSSGGAG